jgi:hypothetical protein
MSKSNACETDLLKLLFNNVTWAGLGDTIGIVGSAVAGSLYVSLHTADPDEPGNQTSSEINYTGYSRVAVPRNSGGWVVSGGVVSPVSDISFGQMTGGTGGVVTHFGIGKLSSGTGELLYSGSVSPHISVTNGVAPQLTPATTINED